LFKKYSVITVAFLLISVCLALIFLTFDDTRKLPLRPVEFYKEEISLSLDTNRVRIECVYFFRNNTTNDISLPLVYPFVVNDSTAIPDSVNIYYMENKKKIPLAYEFNPDSNAVRLVLSLPAGESRTWMADYSQQISGCQAEYILTTTAAWKKPFEKASYKFDIPENLDVSYIYPPVNQTVYEAGRKRLSCTFNNFMPTENMVVRW